MEIINFILSRSISFLVGILSNLSTNYITDKIKNRSTSAKTKSGIEFNINIKFKKF